MKCVNDIYFTREYGELCAMAEEGDAVEFIYEDGAGRVSYLFLKRPIYANGVFTGDYDIVSPYGYGGPVIRFLKAQEQKEVLVAGYEKAFEAYCTENHIVSEFVRFHPLVNNAPDFQKVMNVQYNRHTVGTNVADFEDPVTSECSKSCRKHIRQCLNKGVSFQVVRGVRDLSRFKKIYYATMDRNQAADYYYFDDAYFEKCVEYFGDDLVTVEASYDDPEKGKTLIAMNLCFVSGDYLHIHLSGTLQEYLYLSPAYILRYGLILWAKENGIRYIHHGGGRSSSEEDPLYLFKKQFGVHTSFDFYIGKRICNRKRYEELCEMLGKPIETDYFPAYRA